MYQKPQSYEVQLWRYRVRQTEFFVLLSHFLPFYLSNPPRKSKFWKNEKSIWSCHHFTYLYQKSLSYIMYASRDTNKIFWHFGPFLPYYWPQNLKFGKNIKNNWMYPFSHVYHKWRSSSVWFLRYKTQWTVLCHFEPFFHLWPSS